MKIKLLTSRSGVTFSQNAGDVVTVEDDEAKRMIEAGQAVEFGEVEKAQSKTKPENTSKKGKK